MSHASHERQKSFHDEDECKVVNTVGLSLVCDHKPTYYGRAIEYGWNFNNKYGDIVYVKSTHLMTLCAYLPNFKYPIIIVMNGDDNYFPHDYTSQPGFKQLESKQVLHLFAQNCWLRDHPKFHGIPIGLDYHTLNWESANGAQHAWGRTGVSATQQEQQLFDIKKTFAALPELSANNARIITNFQLAMNDPPRRKVMRQSLYRVLTQPHAVEKNKEWLTYLPQQSREEFWRSCADVAFVLCPPGNGPDTHRAWEVLALGRIPIIQDLSINSVYDDLPVWIVKDWESFAAQSTQDLIAKLHEFQQKWTEYRFDKLSLEYWRQYIRSFKSKTAT